MAITHSQARGTSTGGYSSMFGPSRPSAYNPFGNTGGGGAYGVHNVSGPPGMGGAPGAGGSVPPAPTFNSDVARDPHLDDMYGAYGDYRSKLAAGNDTDAINAMQRNRDLMSGMMKEAGGNAARNGTFGTGVGAQMQSNIMTGGMKDLAGLNANLTSDARKQQLTALGGQTAAAQAQTNYLTGQQNYSLAQWTAQQQAQQSAAQMANQQQQNQWNNQMALLGMMGSQPGYTGYGGGGGSSMMA